LTRSPEKDDAQARVGTRQFISETRHPVFTASLYALLVMVHVAAGALLIGGGVSGAMLRTRMKQAPSGQSLGMWLDFARQSSQANPIFGVTVLATGVYLGSKGWWTDTWFAVAAALWAMDCALAVGVIKRSAQSLGAALGRAQGQLTPDVMQARDAIGWDLAITALRANNAAMLYIMFQKPALLECLSVLLLAHAVSFGVYGMGRLRSAHRAPSTHAALGSPVARA
jgi:hypothetical protein